MTTLSYTENGALTNATSGDYHLDLFFNIAASRGNVGKIEPLWSQAWLSDPALAVRIALWARDIRGGAGEREAFRAVLQHLDRYTEFNAALLYKIVDVGRFDDLLVVEKNFGVVATFIKDQIDNSDLSGLAAKWMPRQGATANRLRKAWGFATPKAYRKYLVAHTNVVEQKMCAKDWSDIEYKSVPSVAAARYNAAFARNDAARYAEYKQALTDGSATINASAIFPHDVIRAALGYGADRDVIEAQWQALPDLVKDANAILPLCDVSGSMSIHNVGGSVTAMDVSVALGLYITERQTGPFKNMVLTFSTAPQFHVIHDNTVVDRAHNLRGADWGGSTDIRAAFDHILNLAVANMVPAQDMPKYLVILSDMEFNAADREGESTTNHNALVAKYARAGYDLPKIVYWNLASRTKNVPVTVGATGAVLVSGFSPAIMKAVLSGENFEPLSMMYNVVMNPRYDVPGWTV
jgi:hypothetical protein